MATNSTDYSGRVRGVGGSITPSQYWGKSTQSRKEAELHSLKERAMLIEQNKLLNEQVKLYAEERKSLEERLRRVERERGGGWNEGPTYFPDQPNHISPFQQWQQTPLFPTDFGSSFPMFGGTPQCPPHPTPHMPPFGSQTPYSPRTPLVHINCFQLLSHKY